MQAPSLHPQETQRLEALHQLGLLDTPADERFDRLTRLAARMFDVPIALVSLVDRDRQWFKSSRGLSVCETSREVSFCGHAILQDEVFVVEDATADPRFAGNPAVTGEPHVRFYAGYPLQSEAGLPVGTLCLVDTRPRAFDAGDRQALIELARLVEGELAYARAAQEMAARPAARVVLHQEHAFIQESEPRKALLLNAGVPILIVILLGVLLGWQAMGVAEQARWLDHTVTVRRQANQALTAVEKMASGQRGYLITGDPRFLGVFEEGRRTAMGHLDTLEAQVVGDASAIATVGSLRTKTSAWVDNAWREIRLKDARDPRLVTRFAQGQGPELLDELRDDTDAFQALQSRRLQDRQTRLMETSGIAALLGALGLFAAIAFFALFSMRQYRILRDFYARHVRLLGEQKEELHAQAEELQDQQHELQDVYARLRAHAASVESEVARRTEALAESEERYRDLFENASDLIQSVDLEGRFVYVNQAWLDTLGYAEHEVAALTVRDVVHPNCRLEYDEAFARLFAGEADDRLEVSFQTKDGREIRVDGRISFRYQDGKPVSARGIFRDVTERRAAERMKDEFLSVVSHELRTPLTSIRGSLSLLSNGVLDPQTDKGRKMLEIAAHSSERLVRLINDILDIERLSSGNAPLDRREADIATVLREATDAMQGLAVKSGVRLTVEATPCRLWLDPDRVTQVITNLLSNAIKFSAEGATVTLRAYPEADRVVVEVTDHGRGIPVDKHESIFERFQQVDSSDSRQKGGTGLGLAICKAIVEQHGGRIGVESTPGEGSTFRFWLPALGAVSATVPASQACTLVCEDEAALFQALESALALGACATQVLIVEDDPQLAEVLVALFQRQGVEAMAVGTGRQAISTCQQRQPDLVVLDLGIPDGDGFAVVDWLRTHERLQAVPLMVYSARELDEAQRGRLTLGPTEFLNKGRIAPAELERRVAALLDRVNREVTHEAHPAH